MQDDQQKKRRWQNIQINKLSRRRRRKNRILEKRERLRRLIKKLCARIEMCARKRNGTIHTCMFNTYIFATVIKYAGKN